MVMLRELNLEFSAQERVHKIGLELALFLFYQDAGGPTRGFGGQHQVSWRPRVLPKENSADAKRGW